MLSHRNSCIGMKMKTLIYGAYDSVWVATCFWKSSSIFTSPFFTNAVDVSLVNAHVIYCLANENIPLLQFRRMVARAYLAQLFAVSDPKRAGRPSFPKASNLRVPVELRTSGTGHMIEHTTLGKQSKCAVSKKNARKQCCVCNVQLHVECFVVWHKKINRSVKIDGTCHDPHLGID